jgi:hypothetical protein
MTRHTFSSASRYESVRVLMHGVESDWEFYVFCTCFRLAIVTSIAGAPSIVSQAVHNNVEV